MDRGGGQGEVKQSIHIDIILASKIEVDKADLAVYGFGCTYARTKVALCPPAVDYFADYWFTRS